MSKLLNMRKTICVTIIALLSIKIASAQDILSNTDVDIITTELNDNPFYGQLWFWIVIGLVFLLLLIALLRGGGKKKIKDKTQDKTS